MFPEPVAVAGDLDHDGVVRQPVQQRRDAGVHLAPGDRVVISVEGVGELANDVVAG